MTQREHPPHPRVLAFQQTCKKCGVDYGMVHYRARNKTCNYCLDDVEPPDYAEDILVPKPRKVRRWWPEYVVSHVSEEPRRCDTCRKMFQPRHSKHRHCCRPKRP